jgi:ABC-type microcin C transport system permease subunit YejE
VRNVSPPQEAPPATVATAPTQGELLAQSRTLRSMMWLLVVLVVLLVVLLAMLVLQR